MKVLTVGTTAVQPNATPFLAGREAVAVINSGSTATNLMGSQDGTTYTALVSGVASTLVMQTVVLPPYIKASTGTVYVLGGV